MKQEIDTQLVGRIYHDMMRATKRDNPADLAALAAWRERHPETEDQAAKERAAILICQATKDGLVWGDVRWWERQR
jgi:hypothetical protein